MPLLVTSSLKLYAPQAGLLGPAGMEHFRQNGAGDNRLIGVPYVYPGGNPIDSRLPHILHMRGRFCGLHESTFK